MTADMWIDYLYYDMYLPHWILVRNIVVLVAAVWSVWFVILVWHKWRLIKAAVQQTADEVGRLENITIEREIDRMHHLLQRFVVEGVPAANVATRGFLIGKTDDASKLLEAASDVHTFTWTQYRTFIRRRNLLRHVIDGLDSLIGERRSVDVAWSKGIIYLDRFYTYAREENPDEMPWLQNYIKAVQLPFNIWYSDFQGELRRANSRMLPRGFASLWVATRLFDYVHDLSYGTMITRADGTTAWVESKSGREAWKMLLTFKAWHYQRLDGFERTGSL